MMSAEREREREREREERERENEKQCCDDAAHISSLARIF